MHTSYEGYTDEELLDVLEAYDGPINVYTMLGFLECITRLMKERVERQKELNKPARYED